MAKFFACVLLAVLVGVFAEDASAPMALEPEELTTVRVSRTTAGQEVGNSFKEMLFGIVLVCLAFPILFFNEKRQVHMDYIFDWAEPRIKDIDSQVDEDNNGRIVCAHGDSATSETLTDQDLGVEVTNCAKLRRRVEMFQWVEHSRSESRDTSDGGKETITTYTYEKKWTSEPINSNGFQERGHDNPEFPTLQCNDWTAKDVTLGEFQLNGDLIAQMGKWSPAEIAEQSTCGRQFCVARPGVLETNIGGEGGCCGNNPTIGDVRITMSKVECGICSVASLQNEKEFQALTYELVPSGCCGAPDKVDFKTAQLNPTGGDVQVKGVCSCVGALIEAGECIHNLYEEQKDGKAVIATMKKNQNALHKMLWALSFFMFLIGNYFILKFGGSLFRFIPFIGTWIEWLWASLAFIAACLCACQCWLMTVAVSWLATRPVKGALLLAVVGGLFAAMNFLGESTPTTGGQPTMIA